MYILIYLNNCCIISVYNNYVIRRFNISIYYMNLLVKNIQTIIIGILIMVVWVSLWFIIDLYISILYKKNGILTVYLLLFIASILLYFLNGDNLNWIVNYGI